MSSETSTKQRAAADAGDERLTGFQPWHLFLIGTLLASSAAAMATRGTRPANVVFVCLTVMAAGWAAYAFYRTLRPLVEDEPADAPEMVGGRTRAALEREKTLVLRAIKEMEFDRAMGKVSEADYQEMTGRLRGRAVRLIRQLDKGSEAYRDLIEKELAARRGTTGQTPGGRPKSPAATAVVLAVMLGAWSAAPPALAQMGGMGMSGMPDAKAMSGIPRPSETVPAGSVSVRLVRGQLSNVIAGHPVEFTVDGKPRTAQTDESGRAVLSGIPEGAVVTAVAVVDGERLESQEFQVPPQTGVMLLLTATDKTAAQQMARNAVPGTVTLGGQSRIVVQFDDDVLQVFYLFDIVNAGAAPVTLSGPLVFEMPGGAQETTVIEGSTPLAIARGPRVTVDGPFAPGVTSLQAACSLPQSGDAAIDVKLPAALDRVAVIVEKAGATVISSPQLAEVREVNDGAKRLLMASGPGLKAGETLSIRLAGLPHHATWPRNLALALAVLVLLAGAWAAARPGARAGAQAARRQLEARREKLLGLMLRLDEDLAASRIDAARHEARRAELMGELERIYGELDTEAAGPRGDVAA